MRINFGIILSAIIFINQAHAFSVSNGVKTIKNIELNGSGLTQGKIEGEAGCGGNYYKLKFNLDDKDFSKGKTFYLEVGYSDSKNLDFECLDKEHQTAGWNHSFYPGNCPTVSFSVKKQEKDVCPQHVKNKK